MRKQLIALAIAGMTAAGFVAAPTASAEDTDTTFVLSAAGGLSISVPAAVELSSGTATGSSSVQAQLGNVTVSDNRGALLGSWTASVSATDFVLSTVVGEPGEGESIGKANVTYLSGLAGTLDGLLGLGGAFTPGQTAAAQDLSTSRTAYSATLTIGNTEVTWNPTVTVNLPSSAVVGTYEGTITHSLA